MVLERRQARDPAPTDSTKCKERDRDGAPLAAHQVAEISSGECVREAASGLVREPALDVVGAAVGEAGPRISTPQIRGDGNGCEDQQNRHAVRLRVFTGSVGETIDGDHAFSMARTPRVPAELTTRPFSLAEARQGGLTLDALRGSAWRRLGRELYCWEGVKEDAWLQLVAWKELLPGEAVFSGSTAGWLLGLDPINPVEIVLPYSTGVRSRSGLTVRRSELAPQEIATVRKLRVTNLHWTLSDMCLRYPAVEALIAVDMAIRARLTSTEGLSRYAKANSGRPGVGHLRALAGVAAPAESPMETRLRWILIQALLPRPEVQVNLHDANGRFVGRADLYYPAAHLVLEYDGGNHRERLKEDDRRQNLIVNAGFHLLRFTAADIYGRPDVVQAQVRGALLAPKTRYLN